MFLRSESNHCGTLELLGVPLREIVWKKKTTKKCIVKNFIAIYVVNFAIEKLLILVNGT